jgi:GNAT superfamily N-acetyltransferase
MIIAQVERLTDVLPELKPILPDHYRELANYQDAIPLNPNYPQYEQMDAEGKILFVTARDQGELVGYYIGFLHVDLHYQVFCCDTDIFYLKPELRGMKYGKLLFDRVESEVKRRGVVRWVVRSKKHSDLSGFFELLGFEPTETVHSKLVV